ncbi:hypothetical protein K503DRAFT_857218 [Rhizopogon vinicolor AM-OR11-026]|uniref:Uncharacterized protein n=1 Tax=Rhizopogon vinicolor AM-OR11-026 TaxID=1314800 RepID=A0A1B7MYI2_9AGAM|nr:hypothetical protein K503DRAFT_857218 [Rhizopogon vinicolor AM-OR11-026]
MAMVVQARYIKKDRYKRRSAKQKAQLAGLYSRKTVEKENAPPAKSCIGRESTPQATVTRWLRTELEVQRDRTLCKLQAQRMQLKKVEVLMEAVGQFLRDEAIPGGPSTVSLQQWREQDKSKALT